METGRIGVPHGEMSKEAQTAMWTQHQQYHDSGIMSGVTTTAHSIKGDEDDDYMKTSHMQFEWETGFSDQEMHAMNEQFVSTRRLVSSCEKIDQHNKQYHIAVLPNSFHLNGHVLQFHPQT